MKNVMKNKAVPAVLLAIMMAAAFTMTGCGGNTAEEETTAAAETTAATTADETEAATDSASEAFDAVTQLPGSYSDETSQRATMTVEYDAEDKCFEIEVSWGTSASETKEWSMDAAIEGSKLVYSDCECEIKTFNEDGIEQEDRDVYENGSGYFEIGDKGQLKWTGAADEECTGCVFVKN